MKSLRFWVWTLPALAMAMAVLAPMSSAESAAAQQNAAERPIADKPNTEKPVPETAGAKIKRKPTLLPAAQRRTRSSSPPLPPRMHKFSQPSVSRAVVPAPLPYARDVPGDRGPPLGVPSQYDPRFRPATPPIGYPPLPPSRQVPGERGIPLGVGPLSPVQ